jgi:hypothetical protein
MPTCQAHHTPDSLTLAAVLFPSSCNLYQNLPECQGKAHQENMAIRTSNMSCISLTLPLPPCTTLQYVDELLAQMSADGSQQVPTPSWHYEDVTASGAEGRDSLLEGFMISIVAWPIYWLCSKPATLQQAFHMGGRHLPGWLTRLHVSWCCDPATTQGSTLPFLAAMIPALYTSLVTCC